LNVPGAYIASDQMTTLKGIALAMRRQERSYVPTVMPLWLVKLGVSIVEALAKVIHVKPIASSARQSSSPGVGGRIRGRRFESCAGNRCPWRKASGASVEEGILRQLGIEFSAAMSSLIANFAAASAINLWYHGNR
jgi:hypothetical protein